MKQSCVVSFHETFNPTTTKKNILFNVNDGKIYMQVASVLDALHTDVWLRGNLHFERRWCVCHFEFLPEFL